MSTGRKALLYKLPDKNYKYTIEEMAELLNIYTHNRWLPIIKQRASSKLQGVKMLYLTVGFFPVFFISCVCIHIAAGGGTTNSSEANISTGALYMAAFILTVFVLLGIVGIISFFSDISNDNTDRDAQEIIEKELNAHTQILKALKQDNKELEQERNYYKENFNKLESRLETLSYDYDNACNKRKKAEQKITKLELQILNLRTKLAKINNVRAKKALQTTEPVEGLDMYEV